MTQALIDQENHEWCYAEIRRLHRRLAAVEAAVVAAADGEHAHRSRDFGRGVAHMAAEVRRALAVVPPG